MYCSYFSALDDAFYLWKMSFCFCCQARFRAFGQIGAILVFFLNFCLKFSQSELASLFPTPSGPGPIRGLALGGSSHLGG